jgi:undecaprenyl diphosphate synthase
MPASIPDHVALIPDGNRRWAQIHNVEIEHGHRTGFLVVAPRLIEELWRSGVSVVTLWLFSSDNWKRTPNEIRNLMRIYGELLTVLAPAALQHGAAVRPIGRLDRIPPELRHALAQAELATAAGARCTLQLAIDSGGHDEIVRVVAAAARRCVELGDTGEAAIARALDASRISISDPDLVVRSAGDHRLSGLLPLQVSYAELYFCDRLFPDMDPDTIRRALSTYGERHRRFGR